MEDTNIRAQKVIKVSRKMVFIVIILLVLGFLFLSQNNSSVYNFVATKMGVTNTARMALPTLPVAPNVGSTSSNSFPVGDYLPPYYGGYAENSSIKDTREFMKEGYNATLQTRDVKGVIRNIKGSIKEADGRIDSINETTKYGSVSFVVAKSKFENFRDEIESFTNTKLYTENISSQNLLGEKQSIEQQTASLKSVLSDLEKRQKDLTTSHTILVNDLKKQIASARSQLTSIRATIDATFDVNNLAVLRNQELTLSQNEIALQQSVDSENNSYAVNSQNFKNQISNAKTGLENVGKQDVQFTDNIETVNGYIYVSWISLWDMAVLFSPIHPTILVIVLVLLFGYYLSRKNYLPGIEFV